jgi:hypothetical protein
MFRGSFEKSMAGRLGRITKEKSPRTGIRQSLHSQRYAFLVEWVMPILEFDAASGKDGDAQGQQGIAKSHLRLDI